MESGKGKVGSKTQLLASNQLAMASNLMASNLIAMASTLLAMASNLLASKTLCTNPKHHDPDLVIALLKHHRSLWNCANGIQNGFEGLAIFSHISHRCDTCKRTSGCGLHAGSTSCHKRPYANCSPNARFSVSLHTSTAKTWSSGKNSLTPNTSRHLSAYLTSAALVGKNAAFWSVRIEPNLMDHWGKILLDACSCGIGKAPKTIEHEGFQLDIWKF